MTVFTNVISRVFDLVLTLKTRLFNDDIDDGWP